jgi:hypothetical protein
MNRADERKGVCRPDIRRRAGNDGSTRHEIVLQKCTECECIDINCGCPVPKIIKTGAGSVADAGSGTGCYGVVKAVVDGSRKEKCP